MSHPITRARLNWRQPSVLLGIPLALLAAAFLHGAAPVPLLAPTADPQDPVPERKPSSERATVEVRFSDNSRIQLTLQTEVVAVSTRFGKLTIPFTEIDKIDFATRVPNEVARQVTTAIKNLSSEEFKDRERASAELVKLGASAYPALLVAAKSEDAEVRRAVDGILVKIKETVPEEMLEVRTHDVIHTRDSTITGKIDTNQFKAITVPFGEVQVKLADMRGLRSPNFVEPELEKIDSLPDPGSLDAYANQFGKKLAFTVTGAVGAGRGALWGTNVYTLDSNLALAAVHAGLLKPGQTGVIYVQIMVSPAGYVGTVQNGITSYNFGPYPSGAYQVTKPTARR